MAGREHLYQSPERAALAVAAGPVLGVDEAPDGNLTVVVLAGAEFPVYVLCERRRKRWAIIDYDEALDPHEPRSPSSDLASEAIVVDLPRVSAEGSAPGGVPPVELPSPCTTWFSTTSADALAQGAANTGVEITYGVAPDDTVEAVLRDSPEQFRVPVASGGYWHVRWGVADPAEYDDDGIELVALRRADGRVVHRTGE